MSDDSVPLAEHLSVSKLLHDNDIEFTERPRWIGAFFRFSNRGPGADFMVNSEADYEKARALIEQHQKAMIEQSRADYAANRERNRGREIVGWIISALVIGGVLWLSLSIGL